MDGWGGRSQLRQRAASSAKVAEAQDRCALVIDNGGCQHAVEAVDVLQAAGGGLFGGEEPAVERAAGSDSEVYVSAASAREIAIQVALDRLRAPADLAGFFAEEMRRSAFVPLGIYIGHGLAVRTLPDHHRDPFDRWWVFSERCARVLPQEARRPRLCWRPAPVGALHGAGRARPPRGRAPRRYRPRCDPPGPAHDLVGAAAVGFDCGCVQMARMACRRPPSCGPGGWPAARVLNRTLT